MNDIETCGLQTVLQGTPAVQVGRTPRDAVQKKRSTKEVGLKPRPHPDFHLQQSNSHFYGFLFSVFAFQFLEWTFTYNFISRKALKFIFWRPFIYFKYHEFQNHIVESL